MLNRPKFSTAGVVVIPAYLPQLSLLDRLRWTLNTLPTGPVHVVVVVQAAPTILPHARSLSVSHGCEVVELGNRVGKWPAFSEGLKLQRPEDEWIVALDADGAFSGTELPKLVDPIVQGNADHVIGQRDIVLLHAADDTTGNIRMYVEAYFNTATQILLGLTRRTTLQDLDIQCGLHAFSTRSWTANRWPSLPFYGGELLLFIETIQSGRRLSTVPIKMQESSISSYSINEVIDGIFALAPLSSAPEHVFEKAIKLAPRLYPSWIEDPSAFQSTIRALCTDRWTAN